MRPRSRPPIATCCGVTMSWLSKFSSKLLTGVKPDSTRLNVEALEERLVLYSVSGNAWPRPALITIGIVPDGTVIGSNAQGPITSNLVSTFDNHANAAFRAGWRKEILRAAQLWAQQTNIN